MKFDDKRERCKRESSALQMRTIMRYNRHLMTTGEINNNQYRKQVNDRDCSRGKI